MEVISEDSIKRWIVPHLSVGIRGSELQASPAALIAAILYRLKTDCQWRELPVKAFFEGTGLSWQGVYHHFRKWAGDGSLLDLSSMQLDGS